MIVVVGHRHKRTRLRRRPPDGERQAGRADLQRLQLQRTTPLPSCQKVGLRWRLRLASRRIWVVLAGSVRMGRQECTREEEAGRRHERRNEGGEGDE